MERIQPPPNYYGNPYPQTKDMGQTPYPPQMNGYNMPSNNYNPEMTTPQGMPRQTNSSAENIEEFYESFNKLVSNNLGRMVNVHCSFTDSTKWHDKEFVGVLASAGDNYIIVYDKDVNRHYLIVGVYIDFIEFFDRVVMDGVISK